jgi:hypothetical protein
MVRGLVCIGSGVVAGDGSYTATVSPALAAGAYDILAAATDLAGNSSQPSATLHVQIQSTTVPTTNVSQVFVNGGSITGQTTANGIAFRTLAGIDATYGYPIPSGTAQLKAIPWGTATAGVNQFSLRFDQDVATTLGQDDLVVRGVNTPTYAISSFSYNPGTKTGTWTLANSIVNDKVRLVLDDALLPGLDGEWTDNAHAYPSGDGTPGGDFAFGVHVLRGDATQDGQVSALDLGQIKARLNKNATTNQGSGGTGYSVFADLNGDGQITAIDLGLVKAKLNAKAPLGEPASLFSSLPVTR